MFLEKQWWNSNLFNDFDTTQCGNYRIFLSIRFYVKSKLALLEGWILNVIKSTKPAVLELDFSKLISRKMWVIEKYHKISTVCTNLYRLTGFITIIGSAASLLADVDAGEQLLLDGEAVTLRDEAAPPLLAFFDYFWRQLIKKVLKT